MVVASSPSAANQVLKVHDRVLSGRYVIQNARSENYMDHSFAWASECNDYWKSIRKICRMDLFAAKMMEDQAHMREAKVVEMVKFVEKKEGEVVKVSEIIFGVVFNVLGNMIFSRDVLDMQGSREGTSDLKSQICKLMELGSATNFGDYFPILSGLDVFGQKKKASSECRERIFDTWKDIIMERREIGVPNSKHDLLGVLLDAGFSDDQINALFLEIFSAGSDTTTSTIEWALAELIKNSQVMDRLRLEIEREIGEEMLAESHIPRLIYLQACVKETLRLHPPTPLLLPHRALESCEVMNYTIPKNCQVMVNVWAIGRDPRTWNEPLKFLPERFINSSLDFKGNDFELIPFGAGRRICPGIALASPLLTLVLASLVHYFDWSLPQQGMQPRDLIMEEKFGLTLEKDPPLLLIPKSSVKG